MLDNRNDGVAVKLKGLYDDARREELALALIPILSGQSSTIDFADVEHLDLAALASLLPALRSRFDEGKPFIDVVGMNNDVAYSLCRAGLGMFFRQLPD